MLSKAKRNNVIGLTLLFLTTIVWGSAFTVLKETISNNPPLFVIGIRFFFAGAIFCLIFLKSILKADKKSIISGMILGVFVALGYAIQTLGLKNTTPSRNAFITTTYCVICPFLLWLIKKVKPRWFHIVSAVICTIGIGFIALSGSGDDNFNTSYLIGDGITFFSAIFFALQIIFIEDFSHNSNGKVVLPVQLASAGVILFTLSAIMELPFTPISNFIIKGNNIFNICYLTLVCTLFAQFGQFFGQNLCSSPNQSALILSLESVFAAIFSVLLGNETLSLGLIIGFVLVFVATIMTIVFNRKSL